MIILNFKNKKTKEYVVGWSSINASIYILNPANISTESSCDIKTYDVYKLIKHELCHSFFRVKFGKTNFSWITEGMSLYVANQLNKYKIPTNFCGFLDRKNIYQESGSVIKLLVDNYGKKKLFEFLKRQNGVTEKAELAQVFAEVFDAKLEYSFFDGLL